MKYRVFFQFVGYSSFNNRYKDVVLESTEKANEATFKSKLGLSSNDVVLSWSLIEED